MTISAVAEKASDEIQHLFTLKTLSKIVIDRNFPDSVKNIYKNSITNIIQNG